MVVFRRNISTMLRGMGFIIGTSTSRRLRKVCARSYGSAPPAHPFAPLLGSSSPPRPPSSPLLCSSLMPASSQACRARELAFFPSSPAIRRKVISLDAECLTFLSAMSCTILFRDGLYGNSEELSSFLSNSKKLCCASYAAVPVITDQTYEISRCASD